MKLAPGIVIDERFEILGPVGSGGMGFVYEAKQLGLDRNVAIKFLRVDEELDPEQAARFEREAQSLSQLRHKNIISVYAFGFFRSVPYLVMELGKGKSLEVQLNDSKGTAWTTALAQFRQICEAIECAHNNGIIHRDIKPSNVLVCDDGSIRLIDFGFAKLVNNTSGKRQNLTEAGMAIGSLQYMSPEQCLGEECDTRSDIYSLGCLFFHLLTGQPPFAGDHSVAIMHQHVYEQPKTLAQAMPGKAYPSGLQNLVSHALAKKREERYQNTSDLINDIDIISNGEGIELRALPAIPSPPSSSRGDSGTKRIAILASVFASILLAILGFSLFSTANSVDRHDSLRKEIQIADRKMEFENPRDNLAAWPGFEQVIASSVDKHLKLYSEVSPEEKDVERRRAMQMLKMASFATRDPYLSAKYVKQLLNLTTLGTFERTSTYNYACNRWAIAGDAAVRRNDLKFARTALEEIRILKDEWKANIRDEFEAPWQGEFKYLSLKADIETAEGKKKEALETCLKANKLLTATDNGAIRHAFVLSQLANTYLQAGQTSKAKETTLEAYDICEREIDSKTQTKLVEFNDTMENLSRLFIDLGGPFDKARKLLEYRKPTNPDSGYHTAIDTARIEQDWAMLAEAEHDNRAAINHWGEASKQFLAANKFRSSADCDTRRALLLDQYDAAAAQRNRVRARASLKKAESVRSPDGSD